MSVPKLLPADRVALETFRALVQAISLPGTHVAWSASPASPCDGLLRIAEALIDSQSTFHAPNPWLLERLAALGAVSRPAGTAEFLFAETTDPSLPSLAAEASIGDWLEPEKGASLILAAIPREKIPVRLKGPGIRGEFRVALPAVPIPFWEVRRQRLAYPLGFDVFLLDEKGITGIPRTTDVMLD